MNRILARLIADPRFEQVLAEYRTGTPESTLLAARNCGLIHDYSYSEIAEAITVATEKCK